MTNNIDGIIYFNHNEEWAKKRVNSYLKKNMASLNGIKAYSNVSIEKIYIPFYEYTVSGNIHSFITFSGDDMPDYYEVKVDATRKMISCDTNELNRSFIKGILPYKIEKTSAFDKEKMDAKAIEFSTDESKNRISELKDNIEDRPDKKLSEYMYLIGDEEVEKAFETVAINSCYTSYSLGMTKDCESLIDYKVADAFKLYFPLWIVKIEDKDKIYEYYINDQTGVIVGDIKESKENGRFRIMLMLGLFIAFLPIITSIVLLLGFDRIILYSLVITYMLIGFAILTAKVYSGFKSEYQYGKSKLVEKKVTYKKRYTWVSSFEKAKKRAFGEEE